MNVWYNNGDYHSHHQQLFIIIWLHFTFNCEFPKFIESHTHSIGKSYKGNDISRWLNYRHTYTQIDIRQNLYRWLIKSQTRDALITLRDRFRIRYFAEEIHE